MSVVVGPPASGGGGGTAGNLPFVSNYQPALLQRSSAAFKSYVAGTGKFRYAFGGDSAAMSFGAHPTSNKMAVYATDAQMARRINTQTGRTDAFYQSTFGGRGMTAVGDFDSRLSNTGFSKSSLFSFGGEAITATAAGSKLSFTPRNEQGTAVACSRFIVYYIQNTGLGTFSVDIDGANAQSVPTAGTGQLKSIVINTTLGNHTINVTLSSGTIHICGFEAYDSSVAARCDGLNFGWSGSWLGSWVDTTNPWNPINCWDVMSVDLVFLTAGYNDYFGSTSLQQVHDWLVTAITKIKQSGADVVVVGYPIVNPSATGLDFAAQTTFDNNLEQAAIDGGAPFVSMLRRLGPDYQNYYLIGYMFDDYHTSGAGCADRADILHGLMALA